MISPRAALMFEVWGADHPWTDSAPATADETINTFFTGAAQFWLTDIFWIKGGAGAGVLRDTITTPYYSDVRHRSVAIDTGFALFGAAGVEVLQSYNFALDIQGRIGSGFYSRQRQQLQRAELRR